MLNFAEPSVWFVLPAVMVFFIFWFKRQKKRVYLYSDECLLGALPLWVSIVSVCSYIFLGFALVLMVAAFARPLGNTDEVRLYEYIYRGCLVLDVSDSMREGDDSGSDLNKIQAVVKAGKEFLDKRKGDAFCIIPFGSEVRLDWAMPLTTDTTALSENLDDMAGRLGGMTAMGDGMFFAFALILADTQEKDERIEMAALQREMVDKKMDNPADAFVYTQHLFQRIGKLEDAFMVVLTDGDYNWGNVDPLRLIEAMQRFGIRVYILGVGFDYTGNARLVELVKRTGGDVLVARDAADTGRLFEEINQLQKKRALVEVVKRPQERSPWAIGLSLLCAFLFFALWANLRVGSTARKKVMRFGKNITTFFRKRE